MKPFPTRRLPRLFLVALLLAVLPASSASGQRAKSLSREEGYAYFMLNCIRVGIWPGARDPVSRRQATIGVWGENAGELIKALRSASAAAGKSWFKDGQLEIREGRALGDLEDCHIVFITDIAGGERQEAIKRWQDKPVLLIGDAPDFIKEGGAVGVQIENNKLRFEINLDTLAASGIELHAQLRAGASAVIRDGRYQSKPQGEAP